MHKKNNNEISDEEIESFEKKYGKKIILILINILMFYLLPLFTLPFPATMRLLTLVFLFLFVYPLYIVITAVIFGFDRKFKWDIPLILSLMQLPETLIVSGISKFLIMGRVSLIMFALYICIAYFGILIGFVFEKIFQKLDNHEINKDKNKTKRKSKKSKKENSKINKIDDIEKNKSDFENIEK